jgi:hypothetical protein
MSSPGVHAGDKTLLEDVLSRHGQSVQPLLRALRDTNVQESLHTNVHHIVVKTQIW